MADSDVIQEFLISLGYKLNPDQQRKFDDALSSNTVKAASLSKTIESVGKQLGILGKQFENYADAPRRKAEEAADKITKRHVALEKQLKSMGLTAAAVTTAYVTGFTEIARQYENLYYIAQRTRLPIQSIAGQKFAGSQVGGLDIVGGQQSFSIQLQTQPGVKSLLQSWGIDPNSPGALDKFEQHLKQFSDRNQDYLVSAYSQMFGLSYAFSREYINNMATIEGAQKDFDERASKYGIDYTKTGKDAVQVTRDLEGTLSRLGMIGVQGFEEMVPAADKLLVKFKQLLDAVGAFNKTHPGAASAEGITAVTATAVGALGGLGKLSGLPLLRFGAAGAVLLGAEEGARQTLEAPTPKGMLWKPEDIAKRFANVSPNARSGYSHIPGTLDWFKDLFAPKPGFAEGGIVPINAHAGEMVLPKPISEGLQSFFGGGSVGLFSSFIGSFTSWLTGSTAFRPYVQVAGLGSGGNNDSYTGAVGGYPPTYSTGLIRGGGSSSLRATAASLGGGGNLGPTIPDNIDANGWAPGALGAIQRAVFQIESGSGRRYNNEPLPGHSATGPMQIIPSTFRANALPGEKIDNPADNMRVGRRLLARLYQKYHGDMDKTIYSYANGSPGAPDYNPGYLNTAHGLLRKHPEWYLGDQASSKVPGSNSGTGGRTVHQTNHIHVTAGGVSVHQVSTALNEITGRMLRNIQPTAN